MCSKLTIKALRRSDVFTFNFEHIFYLVLVFLLLTLSRKMSAGITFSNKKQCPEMSQRFLIVNYSAKSSIVDVYPIFNPCF